MKPNDILEFAAILLMIVVMTPIWLLAFLVGGRQ